MGNLKHTDKLFFLYDRLMVKEEQEIVGVKLDFIAPAMCKGNMVHYNDRMKQYLALNTKGNSSIYGGLFIFHEYDLYRGVLGAYYNSSIGQFGLPTAQSFFNFENVKARPIKFHKLSDLSSCKYEVGDYVECITPVVNRGNPKLRRYVDKHAELQRYHRHRRIDTHNFIKMLEENKNKGENNDGLERC